MSDDACPMLTGNPPETCHGCETDLPRRKDGKPHANRRWCGDECRDAWVRNHVWQVAREAALDRDGRRCVRDDLHEDEETVRAELDPQVAEVRAAIEAAPPYPAGADVRRELWERARELDRELRRRIGADNLEVNHIVPRNGEGYDAGCHHHLDNLETLCRPCHVEETRRQYHGLPTWRDDPRPVDVLLGGRAPSTAAQETLAL